MTTINLTMDWSTLAAVVGVVFTIGFINLIVAVKDIAYIIKKKDFTKKPEKVFDYYKGDYVFL